MEFLRDTVYNTCCVCDAGKEHRNGFFEDLSLDDESYAEGIRQDVKWTLGLKNAGDSKTTIGDLDDEEPETTDTPKPRGVVRRIEFEADGEGSAWGDASCARSFSDVSQLHRQYTMGDLQTVTFSFDLSLGKLGLDVAHSHESLLIWRVHKGCQVHKWNELQPADSDKIIRVGDQILSVNDDRKPKSMSNLLRTLYKGGKTVTLTFGKRENKFRIMIAEQTTPPKLGLDCVLTEDGRVIIQDVKKGLVAEWSVKYPRFCVCIGDEIANADGATGEYVLSVINDWVRSHRQPISLSIEVNEDNLAYLETIELEERAVLQRQFTRQMTRQCTAGFSPTHGVLTRQPTTAFPSKDQSMLPAQWQLRRQGTVLMPARSNHSPSSRKNYSPSSRKNYSPSSRKNYSPSRKNYSPSRSLTSNTSPVRSNLSPSRSLRKRDF